MIMQKPVIPDFLIIGAPKCGTSSLFDWLAQHPETAPSRRKETYFLVDPGSHMHDPDNHVANGISGYARWFADEQDGRLRFEATPSYLYSKTALETLSRCATPPHIIILLREPASQIWSTYRYFRSNWSWIPHDMSFLSFLEAVRHASHRFSGNELASNALENAVYHKHIDRWRDAFGSQRMTIRLFEDLRDHPEAFLVDIAKEIDLDPLPFRRTSFSRSNATYAVKSKRLQTLNEKLRPHLPEGKAYNALRRLYRKINTLPPPDPIAEERNALDKLRDDFTHHNAVLADKYGLDISPWSPERIAA